MRGRAVAPVLALLGFALLGACGGTCAPPSKTSAPPSETSAPPSSTPPPAGATLTTTLDEIAARGPTDAPMMREVKRAPEAAAKPTEVYLESDGCVRAAFAASRALRAWFEDDKQSKRGDVTPAAASGLVPPRGPACGKNGETLRLVVEAVPSDVARAVVWTSAARPSAAPAATTKPKAPPGKRPQTDPSNVY